MAHEEDNSLRDFGKAFSDANHEWKAVCKAMYDDKITYGDAFNDPCCTFPEIPVETITALMTDKPEKKCDEKTDGEHKNGPAPGGSSILRAEQTERKDGSKDNPPEKTSPDNETSC